MSKHFEQRSVSFHIIAPRTMEFTYSDVLFEYNHVSITNFKESLFGIGLIGHHTQSF